MAAEDKGADAMALDEKATPPEGGAPAVRFEIRKWNAVCMYVVLLRPIFPPPPVPPPRARGVMFHNLTRSLHPLPLSFLQVELGYLRRYLRDLPQFPERALN